MKRWINNRTAIVWLLVLVLIVGAGNLLATYEQVGAYKASQARQQAQTARTQQEQRVLACRQFGGLVESIVQANADTKHAVAARRSFGQLFSIAVQRYYAGTGCSRYYIVGGGG